MSDRARAVEECFWELTELLPLERTERDGWREVSTLGGDDVRNGVIRAVLGADEADDVIDATIDRYAARGSPFRWHVGPSSRPTDLADRLLRRGFLHIDTLAGMCIDTRRDLAPDPRIVVRELSASEDEAFVDVILSTYDAPASVRERLLAEIRNSRGGGKQRHYVARLEGQIVGATSYALLRSGGFLQGAAVVEASRGRGVYRQMIRARLAALRSEGCELAVVTARRSTSAPICARLGFEELCAIEVYRHA